MKILEKRTGGHNPVLIGFSVGFALFSLLPGFLNGWYGTQYFFILCGFIFISSFIALKKGRSIYVEKVIVPQRGIGIYLAIVFVLLVYSTGLFNQYHFNRIASGFFVVAVMVVPYVHGLKRILLIVVSLLSAVAMFNEYSRVYHGILMAIVVSIFLQMASGSINLIKFSSGIRLLFIIILPLASISLFFVVLGARAESIADAITLGNLLLSSGIGFDVNFNTAWILDNFPNNYSYLWFQNFLTLLANPIPRFFWESKPIAFGAILSSYIHGVDVEDIFINLGPGFFGELYASGGIISLIVGTVITIVFLTKVYEYFYFRMNAYEYSIFFFVFVALIGFLYRGDYLNGMINILLRLIPIYLYIKVFRYK